MNQELEKQISIILEKAMGVAEKTGEFAIEQAPELLKEFFLWNTASHILGVACFSILAVCCHLCIRFFAREEDDYVIYLFEVFNLAPLVLMCVNIYQLVFILVAPKLYLIDYFIK